MTKSFEAQIDAWATKTQARMDAIVQQSAFDLFDQATRTAPSMNRGGAVQPGFVPRDTGFLADSAVFELNDSQAGEGENAYTLGIAGMRAGDTAAIYWTAVYARAQHYKGWLWVDTAAANWQQIVADNVMRAKAEIR